MMIRQAELKEPRGEQKGKVESGIQRPATWVRREMGAHACEAIRREVCATL